MTQGRPSIQVQRRRQFYMCRLAAVPRGPPSVRQRCFTRAARKYGYRCANCHIVNNFLTVDHIKPKSQGGTNDVENMQLLCVECHRAKDGNTHLHEHLFF